MLKRLSTLNAAVLGTALLAGCGGGNDDRDGDPRALPEAIRTVMAKPMYHNAVWGLRVVDLATGELIYSVDPNRNLLIASVRKSFSVGLTLDALGAGYRFHTPVYRRGTLDASGGLTGDLVLVASGDMSMGGRANPDGSYAVTDLDHNEANDLGDAQLSAPDPLAGYKSLAAQIRAAGITHVRGDVVIDERLWDKFDFRAQFQVSPIFVNDDVVDVAITPGAVGAAAPFVSRPLSAAVQVQSTVATGVAGSPIALTLTPNLPTCFGTTACGGIVSGAVPVDAVGPLSGKLPLVRVFRITQPAAYARSVLIEALAAAGVVVDAPTVGPNPSSKLPAATAYTADTRVAELVSAPYADHARHIMKVSYNIGADTSLMHFGLAHGVRTQADALVEEKKALVSNFGLHADEISFIDGSGDGETRASNRAVVGLLSAMTQRAVAKDFMATFPLMGVDGSLGVVTGFTADPTLAGARGQVMAKTGTFVDSASTETRLLIRSEAFAGYIHSRAGRTLVYQLVVNDMEPVGSFGQLVDVIQDLGVISAVVWREN